MKKLQPTTQYKKDYKRVKNNPKKLKALKEVLEMLMNEQQIPADCLTLEKVDTTVNRT